jgi:hypothetical protein
MILKKNQWKRITNVKGFPSAKITCPQCKTETELNSHVISSSGSVYPTLICSNTQCKFHEYVTLDGWRF